MYWKSTVWAYYSPAYCYGHDEPTVSYISNAPGSGGNASFRFILPSSNSVYSQGDFYATFWLGGTVYDAQSLDNQAFLELQFYPAPPAVTGANSGHQDCLANGAFNEAWVSGTNQWFVCAPVWEITRSGAEQNAANAAPLDVYGGAPDQIMVMDSGDQIYVNYSATDPTQPWVLNVADTTLHQNGTILLQNTSRTPSGLGPYYATAAMGNVMEWGASGPGAIAYAYEIGHALNASIPQGNSYGGCTPGDNVCDSYWPGRWGQMGPMQLQLPRMGPGGAGGYPIKMNFSSSQGGEYEVNSSTSPDGSTCPAPSFNTSTNCMYPYYIYRGGNYSFTFGASNVTNTTYNYRNEYQFPATTMPSGAWAGQTVKPPWAWLNVSVSPSSAVVQVNPRGIVNPLPASANGVYKAEYMEGPYWVNASATGCLPQNDSVYVKTMHNRSLSVTLSCVISNTVPVSFVESGLPLGTNWSVTFNGVAESSTGKNITFNVTDNGTYPYRIETPISGGTGVQYVVTSSASGNVTVGTKPVTEPVTYGTQYYLTMGASPSGSATLSPANGWENSGASVSISATPKSGYTFRSWSGKGPGNYTGGANPASVTMNGPVSEVANLVFTGTSAVSFLESGLPSGTNWSVTMNGVTRSSTGANITFNVSAGNYTYLVQGPLPGSWGTRYVPNPSAGTLQANAPTISVPVTYATQYEVTTFASPSGGGSVSPAGSNWITAGSSVKVMALAASGYVLSGWSCTPSTQCPSSPVDPFTFTVNGVTNITADFSAVPTYPVTFLESGLPGGTSWSVTLNGATHSSTGANITFNVTAGDYSYLIASPIPGTTGVRYVSSVAPGTLAVSSPVVTKDSFVTQYLVTGTASPTGDGSMSPLGSNWFDQGAFVTLLAAPAAGYQFQGWMGNGAGSYSGPGASVPLTITGPMGEEALFAPLPATYTVNITLQPAGCGWVQIEGNSYGNGSEVSLGAGNYSVGIEACPGYALSLPGTRGTGGVSLATGLNSSGRNGTSFSMVVTGDGGLEVTFVPVTTTSWISGSVDPVGAKVTVDNRTVTVTAQGLFNVSVAPGTHQVTVSATGYAPQTFRVSVTAGEGAHMTFTLTPNPTTPPTPGPAGIPWDLAGGLMLVLLVVGVLLGFVIGRRRSRTPPPTGQGTSAPPKL